MTEGSGQEPPASKPAGWAVVLRATLRWTLRLALLLPFLLLLLMGALYVPSVQSWVRGAAVDRLSAMTGARIGLDALHLRFPLRVHLEGLHVPDAHGDTLLHAGSITVDAALGELLHRRIDLRTVHLEHVRARLLRDDQGRFNFDHIVQAFAGGDAQATDTAMGPGWGFTVGTIELEDVAYDMDLGMEGPDMTVRLGRLQVAMDALDLDSMKFHLRGTHVEHAHVVLRTVPGAPAPDTYPDLENPLAGFDIRSGPLLVEQGSFALVDELNGDSLWVAAQALVVEPDAFDLTVQHLPFERVVASGARFGMLTHGRDQGAKDGAPFEWPGGNDGFRYFMRDLDVSMGRLLVTDGRFEMHADSIADPASLLDASHLVLTELLLDAGDIAANNERVAADVRALHAGTVEGPLDLAVRMDLEARGLRVSNARLAFQGQEARVEASAGWDDLRAAVDHPDRIRFKAALDGRMATQALDGLLARSGTTVKGLADVHARFALHAFLAGSLEALDTLRFMALGDEGTELRVVGAVRAPMDPDRIAYEVHMHRFGMGAGTRRFAAAWLPKGTIIPRRLALDLDARGSLQAVDARVDLRSDLGGGRGQAAVWGLDGAWPEGYRVDMTFEDLRLANLLGDTTWGSMGLRVQGAGHDLRSHERNAWLDIEPDSFIYEGKDFSALCVSAGLDGDSIVANVDLSSRPLGFMLYGRAALPQADDSLKASVDLALDHVHLKELGVTDHVLRTGGDWHFDAARAADGALRLSGTMDSTRVWNLAKRVVIDSLRWSFRASDTATVAVISGDAVHGALRSNMAMDTLVERIAQRFERHFAHRSKVAPRAGEHVELELSLPRTDWITDLVVPDLHALVLDRCHMRYDGDADHFEAELDVPLVVYDSVEVDSLRCMTTADQGAMRAALDLVRARYGEWSMVGIGADLTARAGVADVELEVVGSDGVASGGEGSLLKVGAEVTQEAEAVVLRMHDELILGGRTWRSSPEDMLRLANGGMEARDFAIGSGPQRLALVTDEHVELTLDRFELGNVLGLISSVDTLALGGGMVDGRVRLPVAGQAFGAQIKVEDLQVKGVDLGVLTIGAQQPDDGHITWATTLQHGADRAEASGSVTLGETTAMKARARLQFADVGWAQAFVDEHLSELKGGVHGDVSVSMTGESVDLAGRLDVNDLRVGARALGQTFTLNSGALLLEGPRITFDRIVVLDSLQEAFRIGGGVTIEDPADPLLDLDLRTERFHWVNSTYADNPDFYGDLFAGLDLSVKGRLSAPRITGGVSIAPGTDFTLVMPGSKVEMVDGEGVVVFTDDPYRLRGDSMAVLHHALQDSLQALFGTNEVDVRIAVHKDARFAFLLDPASGDQATVRGGGDMRFRYGQDQRMALEGSFTVEEGGYTLSLYGLVRKRFDLVKGGTVRWSGDPMQGGMDISAYYRSSTAPLALVEDEMALSESERNRYRKPLPFDVYIDLGGTFTEPKISFRLDLPDMDRKNYPKVGNILDKLAQKGNEEQLNRQVFGLLVLNSFIPSGAASDEGNLSGTGIATSTARNSVNGLLTDQLNALSGQYLKNVDISVGVNTYDQSQGGSSYQRTSVDYRVSQRLFNDRVTVEVGGSVGVDEHGSNVGPVTNTNTVNYAISYTLTPDGRYRARAYHEPGYDLYDGEITISGVSLQYTKELEGKGRGRMRKHGPPSRAAGTPTEDSPKRP
ncbi:MAG: translocation/assembly module TamB domain-containing protein [Flavobacteriales bacterium]|nr:translocation/assembly module TamB domain-containing protein [Flavobacteriales bacterium]